MTSYTLQNQGIDRYLGDYLAGICDKTSFRTLHILCHNTNILKLGGLKIFYIFNDYQFWKVEIQNLAKYLRALSPLPEHTCYMPDPKWQLTDMFNSSCKRCDSLFCPLQESAI